MTSLRSCPMTTDSNNYSGSVWHHESAREELLQFLADKPSIKTIQLKLNLVAAHPDPSTLMTYTVDMSEQRLTDDLLEALNFSYSTPSDIEGFISFEDGTWAYHQRGRWSVSEQDDEI